MADGPPEVDCADPPGWALSELARGVRTAMPVNGTHGVVLPVGEEPPVRLTGEALERWQGHSVSLKPDGTVNRSLSLVKIASDLAAAGATRSTIVVSLQDRDEALGWSKYAGRRDAGRRYAILADSAINGLAPARLLGSTRPVTESAVSSWPEPEDRGLAVLSEQGEVEYVEDLIRPGRIVTWAAEEGVGKSYAVDDELAIRMAVAGGSFAGTWPIVRQGRVLILSEMHSDDDYAREEITLASLGLSRESLKGQYFRLSLMTAANGTPVLMAPAWRDWVVEWCRDHEIKLAVFDTATGATQGDPWGDQIREVFRNLRVMLESYPDLAIILIVHLKKPTNGVGRRISDVMGEWGRWCDVIVMQERDGSRTKISTMKRVRTERRIIANRNNGLLVDPRDIGEAATKVPQQKVIDTVSAAPGISITDLASRLGVGKTTAVRYVNAAESSGLIRKEPGAGRGVFLLFLTQTTEPPNHTEPRDGGSVVGRSMGPNTPAHQTTPPTPVGGGAMGWFGQTAGDGGSGCALCGRVTQDGSELCFRCEDEAEVDG